jgi:hypothetical protein
MIQQETQNALLNPEKKHDTILIKRSDLENEHRQLLSRIQYLRQLLGYAPLPTGRQQRIENARKPELA